jgi:DNA-binding response OmpR family regulator
MDATAQDAGARSGPLVLLVEDDAAIRRMVTLVLSSAGLSVAQAGDGESALQLARERPPAAVLLDARLAAGMSGLDALSALKAERDVPILIMSGDTSEQVQLDAMARDADDFIVKPFQPDTLEQHLLFLLRRDVAPPDPDRCVRVGDLLIDMPRQVVFRDGTMIHLSLTGWTLLELLIAHRGEAVLHRELLTRALGRVHARDVELLHACVARLRSKIDSTTSGSKIVDLHAVRYALAYTPQWPANSGAK